MIKLIVITLVAVATVGAWVWFRRRPVTGKPLALDRRPDEQSPPKDTHANHRTGVGMQAPITIDEHQEPSPETSREPTIESSDRVLTEIIVPTISKSDEPASIP